MAWTLRRPSSHAYGRESPRNSSLDSLFKSKEIARRVGIYSRRSGPTKDKDLQKPSARRLRASKAAEELSSETNVLQPSKRGPTLRRRRSLKTFSWRWWCEIFMGFPHERKPPPGVRTVFGCSVLILALYVTTAHAGWEQNMFHRLLSNMSYELSLSDCWICSHGPSTHSQGWPIVPTALLSLRGWNSMTCETSPHDILDADKVRFMVSHRPPLLEAPLCFKWESDYAVFAAIDRMGKYKMYRRKDLGSYPACNYTVTIRDRYLTHCGYKAQGIWTWGKEQSDCTHILYNNHHKSALVNMVQTHPVSQIDERMRELGGGLFWICGTWAGQSLPIAWKGVCTVGVLGPGGLKVHPRKTPVSNLHMHARKRLVDLVQQYGYDPSKTYLTETEKFFAIAIPPLGAAWTYAVPEDSWEWLTNWIPGDKWLKSLAMLILVILCSVIIMLCCFPLLMKCYSSWTKQAAKRAKKDRKQGKRDWKADWDETNL